MDLQGRIQPADVLVLGVVAATSVASMNRPEWAPVANGAGSALGAYYLRGRTEICILESCKAKRRRAQLADAVAYGLLGVGIGMLYAARHAAGRH